MRRWDEVSVEIDLNQQIEIVRDLLTQTQAGKVMWEQSGDPDGFRSVRGNAVVALTQFGRPPRYRLHFSAGGRSDFDTVIEQSLSESEPFPEEQMLDAFLSGLHQVVVSRFATQRSAATVFLESGE
jgi:hypothetical protein